MVEPIRQQFKGTCTAFYAIRHFTDLSNDRFGVTVSPVESALVEYGHPRSCPTYRPQPGLDIFEKNMEYPPYSRLYLYLMANMFSTNTRIDQRGPMTFSWSLRSHAGDWKAGARRSVRLGHPQSAGRPPRVRKTQRRSPSRSTQFRDGGPTQCRLHDGQAGRDERRRPHSAICRNQGRGNGRQGVDFASRPDYCR